MSRGKLGPACPKCRQPVLAAKGGRHLSCSPICTSCHLPIAGDDPTPDGPTHAAAACTKRHRQ